jgi:subtilisin family serine protease
MSTGIALCKYGHRNFTSDLDTKKVGATVDPIPTDSHGHGTNIAGLIQQYAGNKNYCMVILRYYSPRAINDNNLKNTVDAINYATNIGAKYINYSGGGGESSLEERAAVKRFLDKGGRFIAAAGNEKANIDSHPYYPAMDDRRVVKVGSVEKDGSVAKYSNYGKSVTRWEQGTNARALGLVMSGTSQATAIATGKIINQEECEK